MRKICIDDIIQYTKAILMSALLISIYLIKWIKFVEIRKIDKYLIIK